MDGRRPGVLLHLLPSLEHLTVGGCRILDTFLDDSLAVFVESFPARLKSLHVFDNAWDGEAAYMTPTVLLAWMRFPFIHHIITDISHRRPRHGRQTHLAPRDSSELIGHNAFLPVQQFPHLPAQYYSPGATGLDIFFVRIPQRLSCVQPDHVSGLTDKFSSDTTVPVSRLNPRT